MNWRKADPGPAHRARAPLFKNNKFVFVTFDCITRIYFNYSHHAKCLLYIIYSLLSLWKDGVWVKGHQNYPQNPKMRPHRGHAARFWNSMIRPWWCEFWGKIFFFILLLIKQGLELWDNFIILKSFRFGETHNTIIDFWPQSQIYSFFHLASCSVHSFFVLWPFHTKFGTLV